MLPTDSVSARRRSAAIAASMLLIVAQSPALAGLGAGRDSLEADRVHLSASMASRVAGTNEVATLTAPNGGTVHEYTNARGIVFALAWRGPGRPDLRQLLGSHFANYSSQVSRMPGRHARRMVRMQQSDLVIHNQGRPGAFWGFAYDPGLLPQGFALDDLQ